MTTMVENELFRKQTLSIMTLLSETARDEIQKVFDCEFRPSHIEIGCDIDPILEMNEKQRRLVRLVFVLQIFCVLFSFD